MKIKISKDSELEIIDKSAFYDSSIESICIPPHFKTIGKNAFASCEKLLNFMIPSNFELKIIDKKMLSIFQIFIPSKVILKKWMVL